MFAASSHLLPKSDSGAVTCGEVLGELVDVSCLNTEEYAQLLQEVVRICVWRRSACALDSYLLQLDHLEDFNGSGHADNMYRHFHRSALV
jgi:hypothetical protein